MLQNTTLSQLPTTQATIADLRSLALALFESLNDKNTALAHQKKANKILGTRLTELEEKVKSLELELWQNEAEKYSEREAAMMQRLQACMSSSTGAHENDLTLESEDSRSLVDTVSSALTTPHDDAIRRRESVGDSSRMSCSLTGGPSQAGDSCCSSPPCRGAIEVQDMDGDAKNQFATAVDGIPLFQGDVLNIDLHDDESGEDEEEDDTDLPPELMKLVESALHDLEEEQHVPSAAAVLRETTP